MSFGMAGSDAKTPAGSRRRPNILAVVGPTASGKTALAVRIAAWLGGEIVSADSRQVYQGMDLGTGKDLEEYRHDGQPVPHHLIDVVSPLESFSVFDYQLRAVEAIRMVWKRGHLPVICGGTGLYVDSVLRNYRMTAVPVDSALRASLSSLGREALVDRLLSVRPHYHTRGDFLKRERLIRAIEVAEYSRAHPPGEVLLEGLEPLVLYLAWPRDELRSRIRQRLGERLKQGMVEEVRRLLDRGVSWERLETFGLEYRYIGRHLKGELELADMTERLFHAICQFSKRQETWFRGMEKKGVTLHRVSRGRWEEAVEILRQGGIPSA